MQWEAYHTGLVENVKTLNDYSTSFKKYINDIFVFCANKVNTNLQDLKYFVVSLIHLNF